MRTLPLRLSPIEGESLPGYVVRYAHTFEIPPGEVVRALGLADTASEAGRYGAGLSAQQLERASTAAGIDPDQLQAMVLARFAGRAFPHAALSAPDAVPNENRAHEPTWRSRFCPQCLREHGAWLLRWQLRWSVVCTRHELLLARRCRRCATVPRIGGHASWPRDHAGELSDPTRCWHRRPRRELCRALLTRRHPTDATASITLLPVQRRIDALLDGHLTPTFAGQTLEPAAYLCNLRALSTLLHKLQSPALRASRQLLDRPRALASVLPEALKLADLPDKTAFSDALQNHAALHHQLLTPLALHQFSPFRDALQRTTNGATSDPTPQRADGQSQPDTGIRAPPRGPLPIKATSPSGNKTVPFQTTCHIPN